MRVKAGLPKAADIPDIDMLALVHRLGQPKSDTKDWQYAWVMNWDICPAMPGIPEKVVHAKLRQLMKRGLVDGCGCGCRGDWHLTQAGRDLLGIVIH